MLFAGFANSTEKKEKRIFNDGYNLGIENGIPLGMRKHFEATSELSEEENKLLIAFLIRHNFVLCYELEYGGFRIRKNDKMNPQKEIKVYMVSKEYSEGERFEVITTSLAHTEYIKLQTEMWEKERK